MFKNKTLSWKIPKAILSLSLYWLGWLSHLFLKIELCSNFPEIGTPCCQFRVLSCKPDRVPIRAREKHYSLVWNMQMAYTLPSLTDTEGNNYCRINSTTEYHFQEYVIFIWISSKTSDVRARPRVPFPAWMPKSECGWIFTFFPIGVREKWYALAAFILITDITKRWCCAGVDTMLKRTVNRGLLKDLE